MSFRGLYSDVDGKQRLYDHNSVICNHWRHIKLAALKNATDENEVQHRAVVAITALRTSTKLLYVEQGCYGDE